jgi:hypothetical protein
MHRLTGQSHSCKRRKFTHLRQHISSICRQAHLQPARFVRQVQPIVGLVAVPAFALRPAPIPAGFLHESAENLSFELAPLHHRRLKSWG